MTNQTEDFAEFMVQSCTIAPFIRNDGYKDVFGPAVTYPCAIEHTVFNITKEDGQLGPTTAQVYLDHAVPVVLRDRITFEGASPKILKISHDYDAENPSEPYGIIVYT